MVSVGDTITETYVVDRGLVERFGALVGDTNPLHLNADAAAKSRFGRPIAPGTLIMSFVSGLLGERLPGPGSAYVVQFCEYRSPVYVGDTVQITLTVSQVFSRGVARISHEVAVEDRVAVTGYSDVLLDTARRS